MGITMRSMGAQRSIFDGNEPLKITKPIRLIELFAGIGAQAKALENLGVDFEHYRICEFDKYAVVSYNAIHGTNFEPSDITQIHARDLGIEETDKYFYIMTYSFPCTDLSKAGKQQGMGKESGTRSGLLWEVERILSEIVLEGGQLPQLLLMENVPDVVSDKNKADFFAWCEFLEGLGYTSKYDIMNAKDYGMPQNRERCFMLSWLGDEFYYDFPEKIPLTKTLKDVLEKKVDEKYYLSDEAVSKMAIADETAGGYLPSKSQRPCERAEEEALTDIVGILLSNQGRKFERRTDIATTLMARDYKGFGNQTMTGVLEWKK